MKEWTLMMEPELHFFPHSSLTYAFCWAVTTVTALKVLGLREL